MSYSKKEIKESLFLAAGIATFKLHFFFIFFMLILTMVIASIFSFIDSEL